MLALIINDKSFIPSPRQCLNDDFYLESFITYAIILFWSPTCLCSKVYYNSIPALMHSKMTDKSENE